MPLFLLKSRIDLFYCLCKLELCVMSYLAVVFDICAMRLISLDIISLDNTKNSEVSTLSLLLAYA